MREILFRGKRTDSKEWIEGNLFVPDKLVGGMYICPTTSYFNFYPDLDDEKIITDEMLAEAKKHGISLGHFHEVIPGTVGQFTGLLDKNGKRIFEGDNINFCDSELLIEYYKGSVGYVYSKQFYPLASHSWVDYGNNDNQILNIEIIGNIHDNK